jgi:hypothetical protein
VKKELNPEQVKEYSQMAAEEAYPRLVKWQRDNPDSFRMWKTDADALYQDPWINDLTEDPERTKDWLTTLFRQACGAVEGHNQNLALFARSKGEDLESKLGELLTSMTLNEF